MDSCNTQSTAEGECPVPCTDYTPGQITVEFSTDDPETLTLGYLEGAAPTPGFCFIHYINGPENPSACPGGFSSNVDESTGVVVRKRFY